MKTSKDKNRSVTQKRNDENKTPGYDQKEIRSGTGIDDNDMPGISESDLTQDDLDALGPEGLSLDGGDDEDLINREHPVDFSGKDLDVPGAELDDDDEDIGSEDEENNAYSRGDTN
jgi:hypothetical protein